MNSETAENITAICNLRMVPRTTDSAGPRKSLLEDICDGLALGPVHPGRGMCTHLTQASRPQYRGSIFVLSLDLF